MISEVPNIEPGWGTVRCDHLSMRHVRARPVVTRKRSGVHAEIIYRTSLNDDHAVHRKADST